MVRSVRPTAEGRRDRLVEAAVAVIISTAALGTSWSSFQAAAWNGQQTHEYTHASALRLQASRAELEADAARQIDIGLFNAWLNAKVSESPRLAQMYEKRLPARLRPAFKEWLAQNPLTNPDAAPSPFVLPSYERPDLVRAEALEARAEETFARGERANDVSNGYTRIAVVLALAFFFGGIGRAFDSRPVRIGFGLVALVACLIGVSQMVALPVLIGTGG
jgi:hypothetical protein